MGKESKEKAVMLALFLLLGIMGVCFMIVSAQNMGKLELCHAMGGVLATDGKCYEAESFELWNETKMMTAKWYDPTGGLYPKINYTEMIK